MPPARKKFKASEISIIGGYPVQLILIHRTSCTLLHSESIGSKSRDDEVVKSLKKGLQNSKWPRGVIDVYNSSNDDNLKPNYLGYVLNKRSSK